MSFDEIEAAIQTLPTDDVRMLRMWIEAYEADEWDRQIEQDSGDGKLDHLVEQARDHQQHGRCQPL